MQINQIELFSAIMKNLDKQGAKYCIPRQVNRVIEAANMIVEEFAIDKIPAKPGMTLGQWRNCDDAGASSKYVAYVVSGSGHHEYAYPHDADDFSRVYKLLTMVQGMENKIHLMRGTGPEWERLVDKWDLMTQLYETGDFKGLSSMMAVEIKNARAT